MNFSTIQNALERMLPFWFTLLFFLTPISTSLKSFPLVMILVSTFFLPQIGYQIIQLLKTKWCQAALFLFSVVFLACFWGPASITTKLSVLKQYNKMVYLPILVLGLRDERNKRWALISFLCAMVFTALLSISVYFDVLKGTTIQYDNVFLNHIMTGFNMSFAACLTFFYSLKSQGRLKIASIALFVLFSYHVLFINLGRSGYVMYFFMLGLTVLMYFPWKQCVAALLMLGGLLLVSYTVIPTVNMGINHVISDYKYYTYDKNTSLGYRIQFHHYAIDLFKRHPWLGNGTGSFPALFYKENPVPKFGREIHEPHGIYWLVASEFGVLGILALFSFFISLFLEAYTLEKICIPSFVFLCSFMIINLSDSLLFYSGSGYLFILFSAYYLSEKPSYLNENKPVTERDSFSSGLLAS